MADHDEQPPAGAVVFDIFLQVLSQMIDPLGKESNLDIGGAGVLIMDFKIVYRLYLRLHIHYRSTFSRKSHSRTVKVFGSANGVKDIPVEIMLIDSEYASEDKDDKRF